MIKMYQPVLQAQEMSYAIQQIETCHKSTRLIWINPTNFM